MVTLIEQILDLDIHVQRQIYAGWPESWSQVKWPVGSIRALLLIESGFASTPGEVAEVLKVGRTSVTGILDRLEKDNLIVRQLDLNDRRSFTLVITEDGRELVRQIDHLRRSQLEQAIQAMNPEDVEALYRGLQALSNAMPDATKQKSESL